MSAKGISVTMIDCGWDALLFCFFRLDIRDVEYKELTGIVTIVFVVVGIIWCVLVHKEKSIINLLNFSYFWELFREICKKEKESDCLIRKFTGKNSKE